ncbi:MAG: 4-hydroxythreonine-4-phosphate dehydrogenase PdxA [Gammaproteobacteria bacterium]
MRQSASTTNKLCLTAGEPAGIGPDLIVQLAQQQQIFDYVVIADPELLIERAKLLKLPLTVLPYDPLVNQPLNPGELYVLAVKLKESVIAGKLNPINSEYVLETLSLATEYCLNTTFSAVVTAPIHKAVINDAGHAFTGHTEFFADKTNSDVVMMLAHDTLRVALVTTHLPLSEVSKAITREKLISTIEIIINSLQKQFNITKPHILVCGLNPHAGEGGHLGDEEINIIEPVIAEFKNNTNITLTGPIPADTAFTPERLADVDVVLSMYHDQGLPVLKYSGFGQAINITLGLPFIRTSVDHGTALELAGSGKTNITSLINACICANELVKSSQQKSQTGITL